MTRPAGIALSAAQREVFDRACGLLQAGKARQALPLARVLLAEAARAADAWQLLGMCLAELGDAAGAGGAFDTALVCSPENPAILMNYAAWRSRLGQNDAATVLLQRAAVAAPRLVAPRLQLTLLALEAGQAVRAEAWCRQTLALAPETVIAWHALGSALRAQGRLAAAADAFVGALERDPDHGPAWVNLGSVQRLLGQSEAALHSYEQARRAGQAGPELEDAINGARADCGRIEEALAGSRALIARHPTYAPGYVTHAHVAWEYGERDGPEADPLATFMAAADRQPDNRPLQLALIRSLLQARRGEQALEYARRLHRRNADDPVVQWLLADGCHQLGELSMAGEFYRRALGFFGEKSPDFLNAYARHSLRTGDWHRAGQLAQRAVRLDPRNQEGWAHLGVCWRLQGDPREAWLCDYERLIGVVEIEVPAGYPDLAGFLDALGDALDGLHLARRAPMHQSVRDGSQTQGRLFGRREPAITAARTALLRGVEQWIARLPYDPAHPFLARKCSMVRVVGSWSVKLWTSGYHTNHIHSEGWISSAFHVRLPPSVLAAAGDGTAPSGCLRFGQPLEQLGLDLPPRRVIHPRPGRLVLFPSYMWHGTTPFDDPEPRLSVAFDMQPAG